MSTIGESIKARREELGISQSKLADMLGYSDRSSIANIESGKIDVNTNKLIMFAEALQTTVGRLLTGADPVYVSERDKAILMAYKRLPEDMRIAVDLILNRDYDPKRL